MILLLVQIIFCTQKPLRIKKKQLNTIMNQKEIQLDLINNDKNNLNVSF